MTWTAGPDLVVPFFMPPVIISKGGNDVFVTEKTQNIGKVPSAESTTRYYLSDRSPIDPATASIIGERRVPALGPDAESGPSVLQFKVPNSYDDGTYFLAACADAGAEVVETDEDNNCSFSRLETSVSTVVGGLLVANLPPDCSLAGPSLAKLWPPNHNLVDVAVLGVTDPENDPVSITVTGIRQDEPVNGLGDGDTSPDGFGVGTPTAQLRAERSGLENGRVYHVSFTADDGRGGSCQGAVTVGVPHDRGGQAIPVDDGPTYDSTVP